MEEEKFDVIVLGAGPGGYPAAIRLAQAGKKVAIIEASDIGGTCLNRGCIPTKALLANAEVLHTLRKASKFGIKVGSIEVDFAAMQKAKDDVVTKLRKSLEGLLKSHGIRIFKGFGRFLNQKQIQVTGHEACTLSFDHAIIATGSEPKDIPSFVTDGDRVHSSTSILKLEVLPKKMVIVGGGVIGCEFASLYSELGVKVVVIEALERLLPLECQTLSTALSRSFQSRGIELKTSLGVKEIKRSKTGVEVILQDGSSVPADLALVAVGRALNSQNLGLDKASVVVEKGYIPINGRMQTNIPHIYAIGDVTGKSLYAHVATHQGFVAAASIQGIDMHMNYDAIPGVIFTTPEIATCGMSQEAAKKRGFQAKLVSYPFQALGKAQAAHQTEGFAQLVVDEKTGQILGAQVFGHEAGNLLSPITLAITNELTVECITETIHPHPTLSESWMESAFLAQGLPLHWLRS
jgi:dihydrolipoamide dehydrogenase